MGKQNLTDQELEIMKVIWKLGNATVREVHEVLQETRTVAYTTVMTMMNILENKKHLTRRKAGRAFVYTPAHPKQQVIANMVEDFVERVFNGSARPLVLSLAKDRKLSTDDVEEIARLIEEQES